MVEREGYGRREGDGHCQAHEKNTTDLSRLKGYVAVIALFALPVIGYYVGQIDRKMEKVETTVNRLELASRENQIIASNIATDVGDLKMAVKELTYRKDRR